jgi:hypothetical protein
MSGARSNDGANGRDSAGHFAPGNKLGKGNPYARAAARLRAELYRSITAKDIKAVVLALIEQAKAGNVAAIREVLDRAVGKPLEADLLERLEQLEQQLEARHGR